jgi:nuclear pore complex protein Nup98-Nup96
MLCSVLWDGKVDPDHLMEARIRKDNLSSFWQKLVADTSAQRLALARTHEEKAIAALSAHNVVEACQQLIKGNSFHLATLIALIGSKDSLRKDIRAQLAQWQESRMLSEFSEPVRALYELLAGNVCVCDGTKGAAPEDRIESFVISKRFGLDWRQAFGLRLWYGILSNESVHDAIDKFADDLANEKETARPLAWYVEDQIPALWEDKDRHDREDLLWGLMQLYAFNNVPLERVLLPENSQLSPLDFRLVWQLSQALAASPASLQFHDENKADEITVAFAAQLTNEGSWLDAIFVLLHLENAKSREKAIQDQLGRYARRIGSEDSPTFITLAQTYQIPTPWIWEAKALYMRSVEKNPGAEVQCLIRAESFKEAHRTFSREVAPKTVIELDLDTLRELLRGFKGREGMIPEWHLGGQIYLDFLELADCEKKSRAVDRQVLERLLAGLPAVVEESRHPGFMERVAVETISAAVAKAVVAMSKNGQVSRHFLHKTYRKLTCATEDGSPQDPTIAAYGRQLPETHSWLELAVL